MGDRTHVQLRVPAEMADQARKIFERIDGRCQSESIEATFHVFGFDEVNYGELGCRDELQRNAIPYDMVWGAGGDYGSGTEYCRFTEDGEIEVTPIYDSDLNLGLALLMQHIDDYTKLKELIVATYDNICTLPWDNQVEYSKNYKIKQLINPS